MKKTLIICLMSAFIFSLTSCKSENNSNHMNKKDLIEVDSERQSESEDKNNNDNDNKNENDDDKNKIDNENKKNSNITDYLTDSKFDAVGYVEACLDLLTKGEVENYMKITKRTKEQAEEDYENNLDSMVASMGVNDISIQLQEDYKEFYKELYKKTKYNVKSAEKMNNEEGYIVTIEVEQITGLFSGLQEELTENLEDFITEQTSLEEVNEIVFEVMLHLMNQRLDKVTYDTPTTIIVDVIADYNHIYNITEEGYIKINEALISTNEL